jgi:hypothetical protein
MVSLAEERMQILRLLEQGQITAEEAAKLISALEIGAAKEQRAEKSSESGFKKARWFRVRVTDGASGKRKVNVNLPLGLVGIGMKMGAKFAPDMNDVDMKEIFEAIKTGANGKIVDVYDDNDGEHVEIFVD